MAERIRAIITGYDVQAQGEVHQEGRSSQLTNYPVLPPDAKDGAYRAPLILFLEAFVRANHLGRVLSDGTGFKLDGGQAGVPDIAFVSLARLSADSYLDRVLSVPPDLAVEAVRPADSTEVVLTKVMRYLDSDVSAVWLVAPRPQEVLVFTPADRDGVSLTIADTLRGEGRLAGFNIPVRAIFEEDKALQVEVLRQLMRS